MQKVKLYSSILEKYFYGYRESNRTILVNKNKLPDSDKLIVTDKYGHRYHRAIQLENYIECDKYIFTII